MSKAVTPDEVKEFHRLYEQYGSYAEVAHRTGRSACGRMARRHALKETIEKKTGGEL